jgi:hypothetical protein
MTDQKNADKNKRRSFAALRRTNRCEEDKQMQGWQTETRMINRNKDDKPSVLVEGVS